MKGLHKKIGIGVLVSGLLIGGVGLPSGSVSYASSKNNDSSLFIELGGVLSGLNLEVPDILKIFLQGGFRGILEDDYNKSKLPNILSKINDNDKKDVYNSMVRLGRSGGYAVLGFALEGKKHFINNYDKYWKDPIKKFDFKDFCNLARYRFDNGGDKFKKAGLKSGSIYKVRIDKEYDFLIFVFNKDGNV